LHVLTQQSLFDVTLHCLSRTQTAEVCFRDSINGQDGGQAVSLPVNPYKTTDKITFLHVLKQQSILDVTLHCLSRTQTAEVCFRDSINGQDGGEAVSLSINPYKTTDKITLLHVVT
jgi:hypothetical protein